MPVAQATGAGAGATGSKTLSTRGQLALLAGDHATARPMHEEALAAARAIDNHHLQAQVLDMLGLDAATVGDLAAARDRYAAAAELHIRLLDYEGSAYGLPGSPDWPWPWRRAGRRAADRRIRLRAPGRRGGDLAGHAVNDRRAGHRGAGDVRSLPGLDLPAETSRARCGPADHAIHRLGDLDVLPDNGSDRAAAALLAATSK
jgi:hypothetical protein